MENWEQKQGKSKIRFIHWSVHRRCTQNLLGPVVDQANKERVSYFTMLGFVIAIGFQLVVHPGMERLGDNIGRCVAGLLAVRTKRLEEWQYKKGW